MDRAKLAAEVYCELEHLNRLATQAERLLAMPSVDRREWDSVAAAKFVADLWLGLENLCKRRYAALGKSPPDGPDSHIRVLAEFLSDPALGGRLTPAVATRLRKYLAFQHRFVHGYGQEITWPLVEEPLQLLPDTARVVARLWQEWLGAIPPPATP